LKVRGCEGARVAMDVRKEVRVREKVYGLAALLGPPVFPD